MTRKTNVKIDSMLEILNISIKSILFYLLALTIPLTGFMLPVYEIKNMVNMKKRKVILLNISVLLGILIITRFLDIAFNISFDPVKTIGCYLVIFLPIEILFCVFHKMEYFVEVFDRMIITGLLVSVLILTYLHFAGEEIDLIVKTLKEIYLNNYNISSEELAPIFKLMKDNALYIIYSYVGVIIYLTYLTLNRSEYSEWKISYQWLFFYIVPALIIRFTDIRNIYLINMLAITKITFIVYGIKVLYNIMAGRDRTTINPISKFVALIIGFYFPNITFILGGLQCFDIIVYGDAED